MKDGWKYICYSGRGVGGGEGREGEDRSGPENENVLGGEDFCVFCVDLCVCAMRTGGVLSVFDGWKEKEGFFFLLLSFLVLLFFSKGKEADQEQVKLTSAEMRKVHCQSSDARHIRKGNSDENCWKRSVV